jgi:hypothetical protein
MPRFNHRSRHSNNRQGFERGLPRSPRRVSDEATSIYVRNLPASADKQSLHDWCQRTLCKGLGTDGHQRDCEGIIDDIWIAKPVAIRSDAKDENVNVKTQKLRYAHVRFQHGIFKRLMMAHAKPEEYDGVSKPEVSSSHDDTDTYPITNS